MECLRTCFFHLLLLSGMILLNNSGILGQTIQPKDSIMMRSSSQKIKSPSNGSSEKTKSNFRGQNDSEGRDSALAKNLAEELTNAGIPMSSNDFNNLVIALTEGGQAGTALALLITQSIAEVKNKQPNQGNTNSKKAKVELSDKQVNEMIKKITIGKDSTLRISQFLKMKLSQLKERQ